MSPDCTQDLWSGRWESNPRPKLGKLLYCHCTTPARLSAFRLYITERWLVLKVRSLVQTRSFEDCRLVIGTESHASQPFSRARKVTGQKAACLAGRPHPGN